MPELPLNSKLKFDADIIVIGGGPAGSTAASLLQDKGYHVILLEKEQHPRFHIGESLLPLTLDIFERLGIHEAIKKMAIVKLGAEFYADRKEDNNKRSNVDNNKPVHTFYFKQAFNKDFPYAYQVRRSEFDHLLLKNSKEKGVTVFENTKVIKVNFDSKYNLEVIAKTKKGKKYHYRTRFLIDASGRDTFLSRQLHLKTKNHRHRSAAMFAHFENVPHPSGKETKDAGNISIYWFDCGWIWMIPLTKNITSIGVVSTPAHLKTRKTPLDDFFLETLKGSKIAWRRLETAKKITQCQATGNYSYVSKQTHGEGYMLIGDAFAFIDPVFSSGVHIAMTSAVMATDVVDACLQNSHKTKQVFKEYDQRINQAIKRFSWLIYRFNTPVMRKLFMKPGNIFQLEDAIISLLAGDAFDRSIKLESRLFLFKMIYYLHVIFTKKNNTKRFLKEEHKASV